MKKKKKIIIPFGEILFQTKVIRILKITWYVVSLFTIELKRYFNS